jgi:hypothetical protein
LKSSIKGGRSTLVFGWRRQRIPMVSLDGVASVFGANAHTIRTYSFTWAKVYVRHNHVDGGGVGSGVDSKRLWEVRINVLIMCSSCNASQLPPMYWCKQIQVSWWLFSPPRGGKDKLQKKCHVATLEGSDANWDKGICKAHWMSIRNAYGIWW